jgi:ferredoxin
MPKASTLLEILEKLESTQVAVYPERCVAVRNRNASCKRCADACTSGAISVAENQILITPDLCIGCGTCATVCPSAALEATDPNDNELLRSAAEVLRTQGASPVFACSERIKNTREAYDVSRVIELTCLARLEESELIALIAYGASDIQLICGDCATCPNKNGQKTIELVQETLTALLEAWGNPNNVILSNNFSAELLIDKKEAKQLEKAGGLSRRDFFKQLRTEAQSFAVNAASATILTEPEQKKKGAEKIKVLKGGDLPRFIPSRRERMLTHLDALGEPITQTIDIRLWGHIDIDIPNCNGCRMCATFCPTGALSKFEDTDGTSGLEHYPADCVQCNLCEDTCMTKALTVRSTVPVRELTEGRIIRYELKPHKLINNEKDLTMVRAMRNLLGQDTTIFERG